MSFTRDESLVRHPCNSIEGKTFAAKVTETPPHFDVLNNAMHGGKIYNLRNVETKSNSIVKYIDRHVHIWEGNQMGVSVFEHLQKMGRQQLGKQSQ